MRYKLEDAMKYTYAVDHGQHIFPAVLNVFLKYLRR